MAPTRQVCARIEQAMLPRVRVVRSVLARALGVADGDPLVQRALAFVVLPCVILARAPREVVRQVLPDVAHDPGPLLDDMTRCALAGLASLARHPPPAAQWRP